jgi:hypothetical protein
LHARVFTPLVIELVDRLDHTDAGNIRENFVRQFHNPTPLDPLAGGSDIDIEYRVGGGKGIFVITHRAADTSMRLARKNGVVYGTGLFFARISQTYDLLPTERRANLPPLTQPEFFLIPAICICANRFDLFERS